MIDLSRTFAKEKKSTLFYI